MELPADLLQRRIHPKLSEEQVANYVERVRDAAKALAEDVAAASLPSARVTLLERVRTARGRVAQFELVSLKRAYKNEGMSEAEIHGIIPDRPPPKKAKKEAKPPEPPPGSTTPQ